MPEVLIEETRCIGCGQCVDFCPVEVFELVKSGDGMIAHAVRPEKCWACDTCVGQCPVGAIHIVKTETGDDETKEVEPASAESINNEERSRYGRWHERLQSILGLRWNPVAVSLIPTGAPLPDVPMPPVRMRHCQSVMTARRGYSLLMPPRCHACPDGTHILGMTEIPPKLASGELYIKFKKLDSMEAARRMVAERPTLEARSVGATLVSPLKDAVYTPDVIIVIANPEQLMWLTMGASYYTGRRFDFKVNGYNAICAECTVIPYTSGNINISLGCYGCRGASDISDDMMFMGIPLPAMERVIRGLEELGKKAVPDSRAKVYLPWG